MASRTYIPWQLKIIAKIILSRLPFDYTFWKRLALFEHGHMQDANYAYEVFTDHFERAQPPANFVGLELGPGDSLSSALISHAFGSHSCYFVDAAPFAQTDLKLYQTMADFLEERGLPGPDINKLGSLEALLDSCSAHYLTSGLNSLQSIPSQSVDFIWSQAVLEHIKKADFFDTMQELRRIVREDGVCSHLVDLKDHLSKSLNNLRFSDTVWESGLMDFSGYTNRIRYTEMLETFHQVGFESEVVEVKRWPQLPIPRPQIWEGFQHWDDEELRIAEFTVKLKPV